MKRQPLVSIVVVTLNNSDLLKKCLESIEAQSYENIETIVVDNGSSENIKSLVEWDFVDVVYIRLDENRGFAGGNNVGIKRAKGDYVALINNDAVASSAWIESMVKATESDRHVGQVASIIKDGDSPDILDSIGLGVAFDGMSKQARCGANVPDMKVPEEVLMPSGCACMFRSAALRKVGFFDEDFFAYCEDADLGLRLRFAGWKSVAAPGAVVTHYHSMTTGRYSIKKVFFVERNHLWMAVKNFPLVLLPLVPVVTLYRFLLAGFYMSKGRGSMKGFGQKNSRILLLSTLFKAYVEVILKLPVMFRKRFAVNKNVKLGIFQKILLLKKFKLPMSAILGANRSD